MLRTISGFDRIGEENAFAVLARATALAAQGKDIINLGIGQPDFKTPAHIVEAAIKAKLGASAEVTVLPTGAFPVTEGKTKRVIKKSR